MKEVLSYLSSIKYYVRTCFFTCFRLRRLFKDLYYAKTEKYIEPEIFLVLNSYFFLITMRDNCDADCSGLASVCKTMLLDLLYYGNLLGVIFPLLLMTGAVIFFILIASRLLFSEIKLRKVFYDFTIYCVGLLLLFPLLYIPFEFLSELPGVPFQFQYSFNYFILLSFLLLLFFAALSSRPLKAILTKRQHASYMLVPVFILLSIGMIGYFSSLAEPKISVAREIKFSGQDDQLILNLMVRSNIREPLIYNGDKLSVQVAGDSTMFDLEPYGIQQEKRIEFGSPIVLSFSYKGTRRELDQFNKSVLMDKWTYYLFTSSTVLVFSDPRGSLISY